jgi:glycine oxidase
MVQALVPSLSSATVTATWAGLRPGTSDGLPLLGQQPSGVWLASGHFRNGVLLAALSGELMAKALVEHTALPAAFAPGRFANDKAE